MTVLLRMAKISPACLRMVPRCWTAALALLGSLGFVACARGPAVSMHTNSAPAYAGVVQEEAIACPLGGQTFGFRVDRFSTAKGRTLDMLPYGADDLPWPLPECPDNGFVVYKQNFSATEVRRLRPLIQQHGFASRPVYARAFLMARALGEPLPLQLRLLQVAAWRGGDRYRQQALPVLSRLLNERTQTERSRMDYLLLQAEYQRRLGRFAHAQQSIDMTDMVAPEMLEPLKPVLECQKTLIAQRIRRASPIPAEHVRCGDPIS